MKPPIFSEQVRAARLLQHLTQQELATKVGCSQSAISYLEKGNLSVVSEAAIARLRDELGLPAEAADEQPLIDTGEVLALCPEADCPLAHYEMVRGKLVARPAMYRVPGGEASHCLSCGTLLEMGCTECRAPFVEDSAYCRCGHAHVDVESKPGDAMDLVRRMQARNEKYHGASRPARDLTAAQPLGSVRVLAPRRA